MIGIVPGRIATRQRLFVGAMLVCGISLLNLIPLEMGPFGSIWPIALLWPACGWTGLGANVTTAFALFCLGLWVDALTGAQLGTWAAITLITHGSTLILARFLGINSLGRLGSVTFSAIVMIITMIVWGLLRGTGFYVLGIILPIATAVGCYHFIGHIFELKEDET